MKWLPSVKKWMDWNKFFEPESFPMVKSETDAYMRIMKIIKKHKLVSKAQIIGEMKWGVSRKFGKYRNRLRLDKRIKFYEHHYEWIG